MTISDTSPTGPTYHLGLEANIVTCIRAALSHIDRYHNWETNLQCIALALVLVRDLPDCKTTVVTSQSTTNDDTLVSLDHMVVVRPPLPLEPVYVDMDWRERFQVFRSTPEYQTFLQSVPLRLIASETYLRGCLIHNSHKLLENFNHFDMQPPPWRQPNNLLASYSRSQERGWDAQHLAAQILNNSYSIPLNTLKLGCNNDIKFTTNNINNETQLQKPPADFLWRAQLLRQAGQLAAAENLLRRAVCTMDYQRNILSAYLHSLSALISTGGCAAKVAQSYWASQLPPTALVHLCLGVCHQVHDIDAAASAFQSAITLGTVEASHAHILLGRLLLAHKNDVFQSENHFIQACQLDPLSSEAHGSLGSLRIHYFRDGIKSKQHIVEAVKVDPSQAFGWTCLAYLFKTQNNRRASRKAIKTAIHRDPSHATAYNDLGVLSEEEGKLDSAESLYRDALRCDPSHSVAHTNLGTLLWKHRQDLLGAERELREALRWWPYNKMAISSLDKVLTQRAASLTPQRPSTYPRLAMIRTDMECHENNFCMNPLLWESKDYPTTPPKKSLVWGIVSGVEIQCPELPEGFLDAINQVPICSTLVHQSKISSTNESEMKPSPSLESFEKETHQTILSKSDSSLLSMELRRNSSPALLGSLASRIRRNLSLPVFS